jgi:hypothetical protein
MNIEFTTEDDLAMNYPPLPASKLIPKWYEETPLHVVDKKNIDDAQYIIENEMLTTETVKFCMPVRDYMTSGYVIRAHAQIHLTPKIYGDKHFNGEKLFWWRSFGTKIGSHAHRQCPVEIDGYRHSYFKYENPWKIVVPDNYSCLFYQPYFFMEERYSFMPGIVDCDTFDSRIYFPGYIKSNESFYINPGDPLMLVFPFKRDAWTHTVKKVSNQPISKIKSYMSNGYKILFHKKKSYR